MTTAVCVAHLTRVYPESLLARPALHDVNLTIVPGEFVALVGRSGSGKTTLLNILGGLDRGYTGRVEVAGVDLGSASDRDLSVLRNRTLGFVFQAFHLLPHLTVLDNVTLPAQFGDAASRQSAPERAREALERVGLGHQASALPTRLSAGERQRVAVARAILNRPRILLCDEPTGNLDAATGQAVLDIFLDLCRADGVTLVVATHEPRVSEAASRRVVLKDGRVESDGGPT